MPKNGRPRWPIGPTLFVLVLLLGVLLLPAPAYTGPSRPQATIVISPSSGPPGTRALLRGSFSGYGSWDFISVYWDTLYSGRHLGGINVGFADGHAKWYNSEAFLAQVPTCQGADGYGHGTVVTDGRPLRGLCSAPLPW